MYYNTAIVPRIVQPWKVGKCFNNPGWAWYTYAYVILRWCYYVDWQRQQLSKQTESQCLSRLMKAVDTIKRRKKKFVFYRVPPLPPSRLSLDCHLSLSVVQVEDLLFICLDDDQTANFKEYRVEFSWLAEPENFCLLSLRSYCFSRLKSLNFPLHSKWEHLRFVVYRHRIKKMKESPEHNISGDECVGKIHK